MHVRPAPGCAVRDPFTRELLLEEGADVPATEFWLRRLLQGDVVQSPAQAGQQLGCVLSLCRMAPTEPSPGADPGSQASLCPA